jgi:hypothetical protein
MNSHLHPRRSLPHYAVPGMKTIARTSAAALAIAAFAPSVASAAHRPTTSPCQPVPVAQTHGKGFEALCRLAYVDHGTVPCLSINTAKPRTCRFTPRSGAWLESTTGAAYAMAGQAISQRGVPGGNYVIASRRSRKDPPPCMQDPHAPKASAADSAGTATGTELAGTCTVEVFGSTKNATGLALANYASRTVCSGTHDSFDQLTAQFMGSPQPGVWCYKGQGAGLNDQSGTERNANNTYLTGSTRCHIAWSGGYEVYAAKRPATIAYPAPGRVDTKSPIVWRPVSTVPVAN